jgi:hypothetical protein
MKVKLTQIAEALAMLDKDNKKHNYPLLDTDIENVIHFAKPAGIATKTIMDVVFSKYIVTHRDASIDFKNLKKLAQEELTVATGEFKLPDVVRSTSNYFEELEKAERASRNRNRVEEVKPPVKVIDMTDSKPEKKGISINTQAKAWFATILKTRLEGTRTIDLTNYVFKKKEQKEVMMANLLEKMKAVEVIPERVEIYVDSGVNYYYIPETLTNQLGWFFACGTTIVIDEVEFKPIKVKPVLSYKFENRTLPSHFKKWLKKDTFTMDDIKAYNDYVVAEVTKARKEIWSHAEYFYRMVQSTKFESAIVYQPNKKVYKELTAHQEAQKQLLQLLPATKVIRDNVKTKKVYKDNKLMFETDYKNTDIEGIFQQLTLSEVERAELNLKRNGYGLGDDNIHYLEVNVQTEHGYAQGIPQISLGKTTRIVPARDTGEDFNTKKPENVGIYSVEEHFEAKAYLNYHMLKFYEKYELLDVDYELCPICHQPTVKRRPVCDSCGANLGEMDVRIRVLELYAAANRLADKRGTKLPENILEMLERLAIQDSEYDILELEDISFDILRSK